MNFTIDDLLPFAKSAKEQVNWRIQFSNKIKAALEPE